MHTTHLSAKPLSRFGLFYKPEGKLHSELTFKVAIDICAKPPSKKRLLCWLYQILEDIETDSNDPNLGDDHLPR
jgi:hypothetical protein